jgi:hypothetical protein
MPRLRADIPFLGGPPPISVLVVEVACRCCGSCAEHRDFGAMNTVVYCRSDSPQPAPDHLAGVVGGGDLLVF